MDGLLAPRPRRSSILSRAVQSTAEVGNVVASSGSRPVVMFFMVAVAFLVGALFGQVAPSVLSRSPLQALSVDEGQRAVEGGDAPGAVSAGLLTAAKIDLAPGAAAVALPPIPGLHKGFPRAPGRAQPLLAIYGDMSYWERYVRVEFFQLFSLLTRVYGWKVIMPPAASIAKAASRKETHPIVGSGISPEVSSWDEFEKMIVASVGGIPDVLLFAEDFMLLGMNEWLPALGPRTPGTPMSTVSLWLFADDVHWHNAAHRKRKVAAYTAVDKIVSCYSYLLPSLYPELKSLLPLRLPAHPAGRLIARPSASPSPGAEVAPAGGVAKQQICPQAMPGWLPHAASTLYQVPFEEDPIPKVLLTGKTTPLWYQYRQMVEKKIKARDTRFEQLAHPGQYDLKYNSKKQKGVGASFAASLNRYLACFTDGLFLNYAVAKVFEIPATGCLLLLNDEMVPVMDRLGFVPHVHYVPYNATTLDSVVDAVLDPSNRPAVDAMRRAGQELVWARHMTTHRAAALHQMAVDAAVPATRMEADGSSTHLCRNHPLVYDGSSGFFSGFGGVLSKLNKAVHTSVRHAPPANAGQPSPPPKP